MPLSSWLIVVATAAAACAAMASAGEAGLIVHADFTEKVADATVPDRSGNGLGGKIDGARFVDDPAFGTALEFDGVDDCVDFGTHAKFDFREAMTLEVWAKPDAVQPLGHPGIFGKTYPTYSLFYDGWSLRFQTGPTQMRLQFSPDLWSHIVGVFDGKHSAVFVNGELLARMPVKNDTIARDHDALLRAGKTGGGVEWTKDAFFRGRIASVKAYGRAMGAEEVRERYRADVRERLKIHFDVAPYCWAPDEELILAVVNYADSARTLPAELQGNGKRYSFGEPAIERSTSYAALPVPGIKPGDYRLRIGDAELYVCWPGPSAPARKTAGRRLNNFVLELASGPAAVKPEHSFTNPREGWIYVAADRGSDRGLPVARVRGKDSSFDASLALEDIPGGRHEAMCYLPAGEYRLTLTGAGGQFVVRSVPHIMMTEYNNNLRSLAYHNLMPDEEERFRDVHNLVMENFARHYRDDAMATPVPTEADLERIEAWSKRGRGHITNNPIPGIAPRHGKKTIPEADRSYEFWRNSYGMKHMQGIAADEFGYGLEGEHPHWVDALKRLAADRAEGQAFPKLFAYCGASLHSFKPARELISTIIDTSNVFALEIYLEETSDLASAKVRMLQLLARGIDSWRKDVPTPLRQMLVTLSNCSKASCSNDRYPWVDYKVFLELQLQLLACDPRLDGLGGVTGWVNRYSDEETLRWWGELLRRYCIEGGTSPLYREAGYTYALTHVRNPEFMEGLDGWEASAVEPGSVRVETMPWYGTNRGMHNYVYVYGVGDSFAVLRTVTGQPNELRQAIRGLTPGKTYAARVISSDYTDLRRGKGKSKKLPFSVVVEGADLVPEKCDLDVRLTHRGITMEPFAETGERPLINYHTVVFRATASEAKLVLRDRGPNGEAAEAGRELLVNFVEVQPYFVYGP